MQPCIIDSLAPSGNLIVIRVFNLQLKHLLSQGSMDNTSGSLRRLYRNQISWASTLISIRADVVFSSHWFSYYGVQQRRLAHRFTCSIGPLGASRKFPYNAPSYARIEDSVGQFLHTADIPRTRICQNIVPKLKLSTSVTFWAASRVNVCNAGVAFTLNRSRPSSKMSTFRYATVLCPSTLLKCWNTSEHITAYTWK